MTKLKPQKVWLPWEEVLNQKGYSSLAGIDEAGCGPLAGPVVAAAVILPTSYQLVGLEDSKKLTPAKREALFAILTAEVSYSVGIATAEEIDSLNIRQADFLAMQRAVETLQPKPDFLLIDAWYLAFWNENQMGIIEGDGYVRSIAAASIIAKVTRDRIMTELDQEYPQYGFAQHKGYPTAAHYEALRRYGYSKAHRLSFLKNTPYQAAAENSAIPRQEIAERSEK